MTLDLSRFWDALETSFPIGGIRAALARLLDRPLVDALESVGVFHVSGRADRYPCPSPGGGDCPRHLLRVDGDLWAVCGNRPAECPDVRVSPRDADLLHLSIEELLEKTARALRVWPRVEAISGITHAYRVGTFSPESGVKSAVYFIARSRDESYSECLDALQTVRSGQPAAVLIPTGRFLPDEARRRLLTAGVPVVELGDLLRLDGRGFVTAADPVELFRWAGKKPPERSGPGSIVARAFVHESGGAGVWEWDLDRGGYEDLLRRRSDFDVFADETTKIVTNRGARSKKAQTVAGSFFTTIRAALEARGEYNPDTAGDASSAKQIFQRARPIFDLKRNGKWELFQTDRTDGHAVYFLNERANTSFAFVFRARK